MLNSEILTQENKKSFMGQGDGSEGKGAMAKADNSSLIPETPHGREKPAPTSCL